MRRTYLAISFTAGILVAQLGNPSSSAIGQQHTSGTGFVVASDGYILTAAHVVDESETIQVTLGRNVYQAKVVKVDAEHDLALIRIEATGLPFLRIGNANTVTRQDPVWVFGFPFAQDIGTGLSATSGHITAIQTKEPNRLFQTDAAVNPGNSGGPLISNQGEVIGVLTTKFVAQREGFTISEGLNFAVPISFALSLLAHIPNLDFSAIGKTTKKLTAKEIDKTIAPAVCFISVQLSRDSTVSPGSPRLKWKTDRQRDGLVGQVHKVVTERAEVIRQLSKSVEQVRRPENITVYDRHGHKVENIDTNIALAEQKSVSAELLKALTYRETFLHDAEGRQVERRAYSLHEALKERSTITYSPEGDKAEMVTYDANEARQSGTFIAYDKTGNKLEELTFQASDGKLIHRLIWVYDGMGRVLEKSNYVTLPENTWFIRELKSYDEYGREKKLVTDFSYSGSDERTIVEYLYQESDSYGNWSKRIERMTNPKGGTQSVVYRTITYH
jgi:hypothetical protein